MNQRALVVVAMAASLGWGCAGVNVTTLKPAAARAEQCSLDVYSATDEVKRPFEVVCLLESKSGSSAFASRGMNEMIAQAKPHACRCGADALILLSSEGGSWAEGKRSNAVLRAIRYTAPAQ